MNRHEYETPIAPPTSPYSAVRERPCDSPLEREFYFDALDNLCYLSIGGLDPEKFKFLTTREGAEVESISPHIWESLHGRFNFRLPLSLNGSFVCIRHPKMAGVTFFVNEP
jgi:hypothetical protein